MSVRILFTLLLLFANCSDTTKPENKCNSDLLTNDTEIYSIITERWIKNPVSAFKGEIIYIKRQTASASDSFNPVFLDISKFPESEQDLVNDFNSKNQFSTILNSNLIVSSQYKYATDDEILITDDEYKKVDNKYLAIEKKLPKIKKLVGFSNIGYNKDFSKAIVYSYDTFDYGGLFYLHKENCKWKITKESRWWIH